MNKVYGRNSLQGKSKMAVNSNSNGNKAGNSSRRSFRVIVVVVLLAAIGSVVVWLKVVKGSESKTTDMATFTVKKGPLRINVLESGAIKAREQKVIYNEVEGRVTIVSIVPEGAMVKAGDLLVELDVSTLRDTRIDQDIRVQNANAAFINATENFEIVKNQAISDVNVAQLTLRFAEQDLQKYQEGEYPNQLEASQSKITLARENLARAEQTLEWSDKLFKEKYIAQTEYQGDLLARNRSRVDVNIAENELGLLQKYTNLREIAQRESDVRQARMALERTERKAKANVVQAEADLSAKEQEYKRQQDKLAKIEDQIRKARIIAPVDGMAIYATSAQSGGGGRMRMDNRQPLQEGVEVFERQELIYLPTAASSKADVAIHESSLQKVHVGLPAVITVDALPDKQFFGTVARIAPLPDPQSMFMNPDLKVYNSDVWLDSNDTSLRTGMSCKVEIVVEEYPEAIYVPVHAVLRVDGKPTVFVVTPDRPLEERKVEIGLDNGVFVRVVRGLNEGEVVSLAPPLKSATAEFATGSARSGDANDQAGSMSQRISQRLDGSDGLGTPGNGGQQGGQGSRGGRGRGGMGGMSGMGGMMKGFDPNATPEEVQQAVEGMLQGMQQMVDSMPPEQQGQMKQTIQRLQEIQKMSPEAQKKAMQEMTRQLQSMGRGGRGGGGRGQGQGRGQGFGGPEGGQ
jgi:HlyD family secretion protein